jgi:hypothetical protein
MISTAVMGRQYTIRSESIRRALLDGRGEFGVASSRTESVDDDAGARRGILASYSRIYFTGSSAWP